MKNTLSRIRAWSALALIIVGAGCTTSETSVENRSSPRHRSPFDFRRVSTPTVAIIVTCTDGAMNAAETNQVIAAMSVYFAKRGKVVIDNPLRADYITRVLVARKGATDVAGWTVVSATYRKNDLATEGYVSMWGDDYNWRRALSSYRGGFGYGYGYSGFGFDDFNPYGFGYGYTPYPTTPVYSRPVCAIYPHLPTYCPKPPSDQPRPVTCPPAPYGPRPLPSDTSVVQNRPERAWAADRLVYIGNAFGASNNYSAGGGGYGSGGSSRNYDSPQPSDHDRAVLRMSSSDSQNYSNSSRYDSPSPSSSSYSSSELRMATPSGANYSSPSPSYTPRSEPSYSSPPSYSPPSISSAPSDSPPPPPPATTQPLN